MIFNYCPNCGQQTVKQEDETKYTCNNCSWTFWNNPRTTVAVVFLRNGEALFAKRGIEPNKGRYDFPGGFLNYNEDPYDACIRELQEEMGATTSKGDLQLVGAYASEYIPGVSVVDLVFVCHKPPDKVKPADDVAALEWKPLSFIGDQAFVPAYPNLDKLLAAL